MKTLDQALDDFLKTPVTKFHRFQLFIKDAEKKKIVGMSYLKEGQNIYTLRIWTFLEDKFFLLPSKEDATKYLLMTREPNKNPHSKNKYFWNIVGNGVVDIRQGIVELSFDVLDKKIFMNIYPEEEVNINAKELSDLRHLSAA